MMMLIHVRFPLNDRIVVWLHFVTTAVVVRERLGRRVRHDVLQIDIHFLQVVGQPFRTPPTTVVKMMIILPQ